ncbi:protein of unknown function [Candidatus Filomicrobium marinum]|uniref:Uncharacterized protein n=1 Tax=Candidatus Filomicrobium marinum TaxID=1608628 RepID=A0A0D6JAV4_9HYPH|nr:protein of unknown function [Candidatus Filomicrobium marinum]CPR15895.1 protein of unknown function [Candidatus Filomicrobium marinum]
MWCENGFGAQHFDDVIRAHGAGCFTQSLKQHLILFGGGAAFGGFGGHRRERPHSFFELIDVIVPPWGPLGKVDVLGEAGAIQLMSGDATLK